MGEGVAANELVLFGVKVMLRLSDELEHAKANAIKNSMAMGDALVLLIVYQKRESCR